MKCVKHFEKSTPINNTLETEYILFVWDPIIFLY